MPRARDGFTGSMVRAALWLLLGGWLGAWCLFAFAVAPTAFRSLPAEAAGSVVGPVIAVLHLYGGVAGGFTEEADEFIRMVMADMMDTHQGLPPAPVP